MKVNDEPEKAQPTAAERKELTQSHNDASALEAAARMARVTAVGSNRLQVVRLLAVFGPRTAAELAELSQEPKPRMRARLRHLARHKLVLQTDDRPRVWRVNGAAIDDVIAILSRLRDLADCWPHGHRFQLSFPDEFEPPGSPKSVPEGQ